MKILYDDDNLVVFVKTPGTDSEKITWEEVFAAEAKDRKLYCVHRLDKEVGGVTVYAKNEKTAAQLSAGFADHSIKKTYLALAEGKFPEPEGEMEDLLFHDRRSNKTYVVKRERSGVKKARLSYRVLKELRTRDNDGTDKEEETEICRQSEKTAKEALCLSLVEVKLHTGRTHQIRIQFASRKHPLAGDRRYGSRLKTDFFGLWSRELRLKHPVTGEELVFTASANFLPSCCCFSAVNRTLPGK